jgi:hypothetical protein
MTCSNLKTESKTERFLGGSSEQIVSHLCLLKKKNHINAIEMTEQLREMEIEIGSMTNNLCPLAMTSRTDFDKCHWHNKAKL